MNAGIFALFSKGVLKIKLAKGIIRIKYPMKNRILVGRSWIKRFQEVNQTSLSEKLSLEILVIPVSKNVNWKKITPTIRTNSKMRANDPTGWWVIISKILVYETYGIWLSFKIQLVKNVKMGITIASINKLIPKKKNK